MISHKLRATGVKDLRLLSGLIQLGTDDLTHRETASTGPSGALRGPAGRLSAHLGATLIV